jgi:hypothetical protein
MLADHVLVSGHAPELIKEKKTPSFIPLTEISRNALMEIPTPMLL